MVKKRTSPLPILGNAFNEMMRELSFGLLLVLWLESGCSKASPPADAPRDTPWAQPLLKDIDVLLHCCKYQNLNLPSGGGTDDEEDLLLQCANASAYRTHASHVHQQQQGTETDNSITLVSYSTANIFGYGAYSLSMNTAYAQHHDLYLQRVGSSLSSESLSSMSMRLFTPEDGANYEPRDPRWNKVQILLRVLQEQWERSAEKAMIQEDDNEERDIKHQWVVWLDSDLVFLDFSEEGGLPSLVSDPSNARYDILVSADPEPANGVVNSGCIVARNTAWTRAFLNRWWSRFDRSMGMDQHAFTRLWEEEGGSTGSESGDREGSITEHIKILPMHALNSHIPAWRHQQSNHPVLHLAGAPNQLRSDVFRKGFQTLCEHHTTTTTITNTASDSSTAAAIQSPPPPQLGLDQKYLQHAQQHLPVATSLASTLQQMRSKTHKLLPLEEIKKLLASLQDVLQVGLQDEGSPLRDHETARADLLFGMRWTYDAMRRTASTAATSAAEDVNDDTDAGGGSMNELNAVQGVLDAFFNYVVLWQQVDRATYLQEGEAEFAAATPWVHRLQALVAPQDRGGALYFYFKLHEMEAMLHRQREDVPRMLAAFEDAAAVWMRMHEHKRYGSGNGVMDPFTELHSVNLNIAAFSCAHYPSPQKNMDGKRWEEGVEEEKARARQYARGLEASEQSLAFFEQTWGQKLQARRQQQGRVQGGAGRAGLVPSGLLGEQAVRLYYAGYCAMGYSSTSSSNAGDAKAQEWFEASLSALQLQQELEQEQGQEQGGVEVERRVALAEAVRDQIQVLRTRGKDRERERAHQGQHLQEVMGQRSSDRRSSSSVERVSDAKFDASTPSRDMKKMYRRRKKKEL